MISALHREKIRHAYARVLTALYVGDSDSQAGPPYSQELDRKAQDGLSIEGSILAAEALKELEASEASLQVNALGQITNGPAVGMHFDALLRLTNRNVDLYILFDKQQVHSAWLPISRSYRGEFAKLVAVGEAAVLMIVKHPPEQTSCEIQKATDQYLHGLMSLWSDERFQCSADVRQSLWQYLEHATVRVLCTGDQAETHKIVEELNLQLERHGGFEDGHWLRVVKGIAQDEKQESLKQALGVCVPIVIVIKLIEHVMPQTLHAIGGVLDDLFGAIIPDVSQSMGKGQQPRRQRLRNAWPVLRGGLATLPLAVAFGAASAVLYDATDSTLLRAAAGVLFAFACCAGTLGTSIAAFRKAYLAINELSVDQHYGYLVEGFSRAEKLHLAFRESIMDIPFRLGHTVIGVPFQLALGVTAGVCGFFHSGLFVMVEGMAETLLGAFTAFAYPQVSKLLRNLRLRRTEIVNEQENKNSSDRCC